MSMTQQYHVMPKKPTLNQKEIKSLVALLKKVRLPAPYPVFAALAKSVTLVAVDIAVMSSEGSILLTHRTDAWYDCWHIPGGILLHGENPQDAAIRVARVELGGKASRLQFIHYFFETTVRGNEVVLLFKAVLDRKPANGSYFPLRKTPKEFLEEQREEINYLKKHYI